jgi:hypothetical protein
MAYEGYVLPSGWIPATVLGSMTPTSGAPSQGPLARGLPYPSRMRHPIVLSWSGGKDCAFALHTLRSSPAFEPKSGLDTRP